MSKNMTKKLLLWKAPLDSAMIDPDDLRRYLDQGWKEVGVIYCQPISGLDNRADTSTPINDKTGSDRVRRGADHAR